MTTLLRDLEAFYQEPGRCGELDGGVQGERVWTTCTCGERPSPSQFLNEPESCRQSPESRCP